MRTRALQLWKQFLAVSSIIALSACATIHPGETGEAVGPENISGLVVSAESIENKPAQAFQLIEVTFENTKDDWIRINHIELYNPNSSENKVSAIVGADLKTWTEAMKYKMSMDSHNDDMVKSALLGTGYALAAGNGKDSNAAAVGVAMMVGTVAWAVTDSIKFGLDQATQSEKVPENHLYRSFAVPGKMFMRRWLLVNRPSGQVIKNLVLLVETLEGQKEYVQIKL